MLGATILGAVRTELGPWRWTQLPAPWLLTVVALVLFLLARALYRTEKGRAPAWLRFGLAGLRAGILLLLLLVLAGPYRDEVSTVEERADLVLLLDTSGSMDTKDRYPPEVERALMDAAWPEASGEPRPKADDVTRDRWMRRIVAGSGDAVLRSLADRFVVHAYAFDSDWRALGSTRDEGPKGARDEGGERPDPVARIGETIRGLEAPRGERTHLGTALRNVAGEFLGTADPRLAVVLLVTDGRDTADGPNPLEVVQNLRAQSDVRVVAVAIGNPASGRNARLEPIRAKDVVLVDDEVVFETAVRHTGFTDLDGVTVGLTIEKVADADGRELPKPVPYKLPPRTPAEWTETRPFRLPDPAKAHPVRLRAPFHEAGTFRVTAEVRLPPEAQAQDAVREDDRQVHEIRVVDQRIKILFADYGPRYDWRFLSNWLTREADAKALRAPGAAPSRRRYAAHVLLQTADPTVELPYTRDGDMKPLRSFPTTRKELFEYDVVILGDVDLDTLAANRDDARKLPGLLVDFVREGGGLALEAGTNYRNPLGFVETPLRDLVPVQVHDRDQEASEHQDVAFHAELTDAGREHPILSVVPGKSGPPTPEDVAEHWARPDWTWWWMYRAKGGLKPGAIALATAKPEDPGAAADFRDERNRPLVMFATMGYGRGRVFWSSVDHIAAIRRARRDQVYGAFWDQVIRYLATYRLLGGNKRFKILPDKDSYIVGETATITITALDKDFAPLEEPVLDGLHVEAPRETLVLDESKKPRSLVEEGGAPGTYRFYLPIRESGTYRLWIETPSELGVRTDRAERRIRADFRSPEKRETVPNHELLGKIARETGGHVVPLHHLPALARDPARLPARTIERVLDRKEQTQWDAPWVLLLLVALLAVEWLARKRAQMI
jgi:uncharacterized membrane protein